MNGPFFFAESDICFTPVLTLDEVCRHPQLLAREMVHTLTNVNDSGQDIVLTGIPIKLSETPGHLHLAFPELGEHSREVLLTLGYGEEEIEALRQGGVI